MTTAAQESSRLVDSGLPSKSYGVSAVSADTGPNSVSFHNITYIITPLLPLKGREPKVILSDCSGVMHPGLNAIMGPTGSGKTSLLDILAGRKGRSGLNGTLLVNGQRQPRNFKCMSGYVVQDDMVMGTLSVRENLYFSAALRLPNSISWKEKRQRVQKIIEDLGLTACADTKVGNEFFRGVSGGERKRTNIGMELIIEPQVLFLDEPTTGLDAFTAVSVIQLLKNLAKESGRVVVMSIHQPRYSIYKLCDSITLLSRGEMVYHGPKENTLGYFARQGFHCEEHDNPADFLLDVINYCEGQRVSTDLLAIETGSAAATADAEEVHLPTRYRDSEEYNKSMSECNKMMNELMQQEENIGVRIIKSARYRTSFLWQLLIVLIRSTVNILRYPTTSFLQLFITVIFAAIVGAIYFQIGTRVTQVSFGDRLGAFFFIVMNQVFSNLSAVDVFMRQKALFKHENSSGYYRVSAYFIAKIMCDLIPLRLIPLCLFTVIVYFMLSLQVEVDKFFIFFLTLFLTSLASSAAAFWISAAVNVLAIANLLLALSFVFQMLFGGFLVAISSLPVWVSWLKFLSIFRYAVEALAVNEIKGLQFNITGGNEGPPILINGSTLLTNQGYEVDWLWWDQIGLAGISILLLTLAYLTLLCIKKEK